jgi:hypothetical protein
MTPISLCPACQKLSYIAPIARRDGQRVCAPCFNVDYQDRVHSQMSARYSRLMAARAEKVRA